MLNSKLILIIAAVLIFVGVFKPQFPFVGPNQPVDVVVNPNVEVDKPKDEVLLEKAKAVTKAFDGSSFDRNKDSQRLALLYLDLATLIELDGEQEVVKTTEEIRQANSLTGAMLRLNLKGAYPGLSDAANDLLISQIGEDIVPLDSNLRAKAVDAFRALAWACFEGSK
jgi:hypothetical protein